MSLVYPYHSHHHGFYAPVRRAPVDFGFGFSNPWFSQDFQPFALANQFQLLDDTFSQLSKLSAQTSSFAPKFDIKETEEAYQLDGELPGVEEKDLNIEFVNDSTLRIKGRTETVKEEGQRPQQLQKPQAQPQQALEQSQEQQAESTTQTQSSKQATVEDESAETAEASGALPTTETTEPQSETANTEATASAPAAETEPASTTEAPYIEASQEVAAKPQTERTYWYSERRVGSFQRTFNFPAADVDHAAVKASLKNGVLSMTIPKKAKQAEQASRKVQISSEDE